MQHADIANPSASASAKVDAWTSFVVDPATSKIYSVANGGHTDYDGNEVDVFDVERPDPTWSQALARSPSQNADYYPNGTPTSRHTYYGVTFDPFNQRVMLFSGSPWERGAPFLHTIDSYNLSTNSYSPQGYHPLIDEIAAFGMDPPFATATDPATANVYVVQQFRMWRWNRMTGGGGTVEDITPSGSGAGGYMTMSAFDGTRSRIFYLGGNTGDHHLYTLATNAWSAVDMTGANAADVLAASQTAMTYVPAIDLFLVRLDGAGSTVYQVDPTTFSATVYPTTGGSAIPSTANGPFNKFLYVPRLHGAVYVPTYSGNAFFLRLH